MIYLWAILLVIVNAAWLASVVVGLPGNWLMVATTVLVAWLNWDAHMFSVGTLVAIVVLAAVGELLEFVAGMAGVTQAGGTRYGALGALVGGLVGAVACTFLLPIPLVGTLLGACVGAGLGAYLMERAVSQPHNTSAQIGVSAGFGRLWGTLIKIAIGVAIWIIVAVAAFWP